MQCLVAEGEEAMVKCLLASATAEAPLSMDAVREKLQGHEGVEELLARYRNEYCE